MKYVLLFIILCATCYVIYQTVRIRRLISLGSTVAEEATPYEQSPENPSVRILFAGDSTAVGTGASTPENSLAGLAGARYPDATIVNIGVNGAKIHDAIMQLRSLPEGEHYDILFLHIGGNDIVRRTPLHEVRQSYQELLSLAAKKATYVLHTSTGNVGTAPFFPALVGYYYSYRTKQVINIFLTELQAQDSEHIRYTYLYTTRANDPFLKDVNLYYLRDYFHPSDAGYALWWNAMEQELDTFDISST